MTWAPTETQKAIYAVLNGDATLTALLGSGKIFDHVPDNTSYPYAVLMIFPFNDRGSYTTEGLNAQFQISTWVRGSGRGDKEVQSIQKRIDELLHKANLTIEGWGIISLRRELIEIRTEDDNVTKEGIQRFRLLMGAV